MCLYICVCVCVCVCFRISVVKIFLSYISDISQEDISFLYPVDV